MTIFDKKELTQTDVNELNKLLCQADFNTLRKATRKILGDEVDERDVERKFKNLRKKLNKFGYTKNSDTNLYENKKVEIKSEINEDKNEEKKNKKSRRTKAEIKNEQFKKEFEEKMKVNPLCFFSSTGTEIYETLIHTQNNEINWVGAYIMNEVAEEFKTMECGCQLIDTYKLIDASIQLTYRNRINLKNHNFNHDFYELIAKNKLNGSKKKQLNLELSDTAVKCLKIMLAGDFAMFNKSQLINYCMFVAAKSAENSCFKDVKTFDLKQRKKEKLAKKITGRKQNVKNKQ